MPESELDMLYKLLIETKYKGNPETVQKLLIENELNPQPYCTLDECIKKYDVGVLSREDLAIKANFTAFIKRFERENGDLVSFGAERIAAGQMTRAQKIQTILETLKTYIPNGTNNTEQATEQGD